MAMGWQDIGDLECGHCRALFSGTIRQIKRVKYENNKVYCSPTCQRAAMSAFFRQPKPVHGPCPTCNKMFESRRPKIFCSMTCYIASPAAKARLKENALKGSLANAKLQKEKASETRQCLDCGADFKVIKSRDKRFCNKGCWRSYLAKRFDRWIASPERIALPQNFDEFLSMEELPCLVEGCSWAGAHLTLHMNQAHGVPSREFKRAAGFNLHTGVVGRGLADVLRERPSTIGVLQPFWGKNSTIDSVRHYCSLESKEHRAKARALVCESAEPRTRSCAQCQQPFKQSTPFGTAKFCCNECHNAFLRTKRGSRNHPTTCAKCGSAFLCNRGQQLRQERGTQIFCSASCKGQALGRLRKKSPTKRREAA